MKSILFNHKPGMWLGLILVAFLLYGQKVAAQDAYAVLSADSTTLTFYYDTMIESREGTKYNNLNFGDDDPAWYKDGGYQTITKVVFDNTFEGARPTSTSLWFMEMTGLTSISGMENLNTSEVTEMFGMFAYCSALRTLDLSHFNTEKVTTMNALFFGCEAMESLDLSSFDTKNVTNMGSMFSGCKALTSLSLTNFDTRSVTSMGSMFSGCKALTSLSLSNFDTRNVKYMSFMFNSCSSLTRLDLSSFNTQNVTSMNYMFYGCSSLSSLDLSSFNTQNVTSMNHMFYGCSSLTSLDLSSFNTKNVNNMNGMFSGCSSLTSIDIPNTLEKIDNEILKGCSSLASVTIPNSVGSIENAAFADCSKLTSVTVKLPEPLAIEETTFVNQANATLYIPTGCRTAYETADYWKEFGEFVEVDFDSNIIMFADVNVRKICVNQYDTDGDGELSYTEAAAVTSLAGFSGNTSITKFNELRYFTGLTELGKNVFKNCSSLSSITIPNSITSIAELAFFDCSSLTAIIIPSSVNSFDSMSFSGCTCLETIVVEPGNATYDSREGCNAIIETASNTLIIGCKNTVIPGDVTTIGNSAFLGCTSLTSISIPNNVTTISKSAFSGCSGLTSIVIPNTVTTIGGYAFMNCSSLTSIVIPEGVTAISSYTFYGCSGLTLIAIPNTVTTIEVSAFYGCSGLTSIVISEGVTTIHSGAFANCSGLTSVHIPSSVVDFGRDPRNGQSPIFTYEEANVFGGCTNLETITVDINNPKYDSRDNCNAIIETESNTLLSGCNNTVVPNSVTAIGNGAFQGCDFTSTDFLPDGVIFIGNNVFKECSNLEEVNLPSSVLTVGRDAFYGTPWFDNQPDGVVYAGNSLYAYKGTMPENTQIEVREGTTSITSYVFRYATRLTAITFPNSLKYIGYSSFQGCDGLTTISLPESMISLDINAFQGCRNLATLNIANGLQSIGKFAFSGCTSLTSLVIPGSVESIGYAAFTSCIALTSLTLSEGLKFIGDGAFSSAKISTLIIPNGVTTIGNDAFSGLSNLTSLTIPGSLTNIGSSAFFWCPNLVEIYSKIASPFEIDEDVFDGTSVYQTAILYVPAGCADKYRATAAWNMFQNIQEMDLEPVDNGETINIGDEIDENTNLDGNVVGNVLYSISSSNGGYDSEEGCIVVNTPMTDEAMGELEGKDIFGEDFKDQYTGLVIKVTEGSGKVSVQAETTGSMVLKVKVGNNDPIELEFEGKLKMSVPYNVTEDSYVYIYGSTIASLAKGKAKKKGADALKIYSIEVVRNQDVGDMNNDRKIDAVDLEALINAVLKKNVVSYERRVADVNGDGDVNIADVTKLVNFILKKE